MAVIYLLNIEQAVLAGGNYLRINICCKIYWEENLKTFLMVIEIHF